MKTAKNKEGNIHSLKKFFSTKEEKREPKRREKYVPGEQGEEKRIE